MLFYDVIRDEWIEHPRGYRDPASGGILYVNMSAMILVEWHEYGSRYWNMESPDDFRRNINLQ